MRNECLCVAMRVWIFESYNEPTLVANGCRRMPSRHCGAIFVILVPLVPLSSAAVLQQYVPFTRSGAFIENRDPCRSTSVANQPLVGLPTCKQALTAGG